MIFLDTSGLLSHINSREPHHQTARNIARAANLLTTNYVVAEFFAAMTRTKVARETVFSIYDTLGHADAVELVFVTRDLHNAAVDLLRDRPDKRWSLCDAVSFVLMEQRSIRQALTTDRHFEQAGFERLLK